MPLCLVKAASTSSSAFFIEAAAKTVMDLSCAVGGERRRRQSTTVAATAARMAFLVSTTVLQQAIARASCARRTKHMTRESDTTASGTVVPGIYGARPAHRRSRWNNRRSAGRGQATPGSQRHGSLPPGQPCYPFPRRRVDERGGADRRRVRLHHRRRGLGRLRAGQSALGRCRQARADSRSRRPRQLDLVSHSGRLSVRHRQSALGLVLQDRARSRASTAAA